MKFIFGIFFFLMAFAVDLYPQEPLYAAPTKDFLLGKTHFEDDTNFVQINKAYTTLREPNNYIQKQTYSAFLKMREAARQDGIRIIVTSASRNFWVQRYIWEQKWKNSSIVSGEQRARNILRYNSMCGTSRHHWGTELDFNSPKLDYWNSEEGKKVYKWLCENAHKYGFYQPYSKKGEPDSGLRAYGYNEEKWHWSYWPLSEVYLESYRTLINDKDLEGFLGDEYVPDLKIIEYYVLGVATPPEV